MERILVGTDTSASADLAVKTAAELARASDAELLVLHVRPLRAALDAADPRKSADPDRYLAAMIARFPDLRVRSMTERGDPAERLCAVAADEHVDAIVVGNRGLHGPRWRVRESVPASVARRSPCSVLIVDTRVAQ
jgi:nucleotide-binding universal stress UspA family protein